MHQVAPAVWDFPGGHVEPGETPLGALQREIREELGVAVHVDVLTEVPDLRVPYADLDLSLWVVRAWEGEPINSAPEEHDRIEWFGVNEAIRLNLAHTDHSVGGTEGQNRAGGNPADPEAEAAYLDHGRS